MSEPDHCFSKKIQNFVLEIDFPKGDVWLMKEYGNKDSWTKLFRLPHTRDLGSWMYGSALYVSQDDQVLCNIEREKLVVYHIRDDTFKDPGIQNIDGWMDSEVYHESLISPCF
ncbi:hypothetical protein KIW84_014978 [Lathyrus oleraceus]|uniref:F-box protein n=1 Tax=Pisum sativum TaxID=3888 RepID=A0A9D5BPH9_PEA|nr:hypothetical protein KIW84_014978 [Pisum sativum]